MDEELRASLTSLLEILRREKQRRAPEPLAPEDEHLKTVLEDYLQQTEP